MLDIFLVFFVTLSLFPSILINVKNENNAKFGIFKFFYNKINLNF